jgi:hypothetical protein
VLPWVAVGLVLVEFALADDLPDERVRRVFAAAGVAVLFGATWKMPLALLGPTLAIAAGPLAFLVGHGALRHLFRRWKGEEPVLATRGSASASGGRAFFEPAEPRTVGWRDYLYSFLLGLAMLLCVSPALADIIVRAGP